MLKRATVMKSHYKTILFLEDKSQVQIDLSVAPVDSGSSD